MRIVCYIGQVPDTSLPIMVSEGSIDQDGLAYMVNQADLCAVEAAVRLKEQRVCDEIVIVAMGGHRPEALLRTGLAMGADRSLFLDDPSFVGSDAYAVAQILVIALRELEPDLVLCGTRTLDTGESEVPGMLAELLGFPQISGVIQLELGVGCKVVRAWRRLERGEREMVECDLPALLILEPGINEPRHASLPALLDSFERPIETRNAAALGLSPYDVGPRGSLTRVAGHTPPRPRPKKVLAPDAGLSAAERMQLIMSGGLRQPKEAQVREGTPEELASAFIRLLKAQGLLPS